MKKPRKTRHKNRSEAMTKVLTKRELALRIADDVELTQQQVFEVVQKTLDCIVETLLAERPIEFRDFGVFKIVVHKSRIGRNPNKPADTVRIPERKVVKFQPGKLLKQRLLAKSSRVT